MPSKKTNPAEAAAEAKFTTSRIKPADVASETQKVADVAKANPAYSVHPEIQQAVVAWIAAATAVDDASQKLKAAHLALTALVAALATSMAAWRRSTQAVIALVNTASAGSDQAIKLWGFATTARQILAATSSPPAGLRVVYGKQLVMTVRWSAVTDHIGYALQIGDGTPQGWGATIACPRASYQPQGLAPGQKVAFRVAVQRKNGLSAWSDALSVTVR